MPNRDPEFDDAVQTESRQKLKKPPLYKVLLHNDNYTTMEFVVWVLQTIFHHNEADAFRIMLQVHVQGIGIAGIYPYEVAEMKVSQVSAAAREFEYPLLCTMDEEQ
ncbi:MAG: ATP-dependent Clp protease adaptor ClpS [Acidobacteriota bacterium]|nr:MAG: ATP-dependent Clp protease adaptor ClpS [Acidobacteriota bacterium]